MPPRLTHERFPSSRRWAWGRGMGSILILVALSALSGFVLASYFSWPAILVAGVVLAMLSAIVFQNQGFGALSGISVMVACLTINQIAYLIGRSRADDGPNGGSTEGLPHQRPDDELRESRDDNIRNEHNRHQNSQSDLMHPAELPHTNSTCRFHGTSYIGVALSGMSHLVALFAAHAVCPRGDPAHRQLFPTPVHQFSHPPSEARKPAVVAKSCASPVILIDFCTILRLSYWTRFGSRSLCRQANLNLVPSVWSWGAHLGDDHG
jgi:hypothetical protein